MNYLNANVVSLHIDILYNIYMYGHLKQRYNLGLEGNDT